MSLAEFSLKRPVTTMMIFLCFVVVGVITARMLPLAYFPDIDVPFIYIDIPYPGSTPEEIERQITRPAEEVLATISGYKRMRSWSRENGAGIQFDFNWGVDANLKALEAREKLEGIRSQFPDDLERFHIHKFSTNDMAILQLRISSNRDLSNAWDMLNRNVKRRIERIPGISKVDLYGIERREIRIQLHADRVIEHRIDLARLTETLRRENFLATAGKITDHGQRLVVRPEGALRTVDEIGSIVVGEHNLHLRDIAEIAYDHPELTYGRHLDRKYAIGVEVFKESGANLVAVANRVSDEIDRIRDIPEMAGIAIYYMDNTAEGVQSSLREVLKAGLLGGALAVVLLYFFLRRLATTLIVALAVPLSLLVTLSFMYFLGLSLNILSMMGLMLAVGMLVDNAVVVTESIHRHQHRHERPRQAILKGVGEVALAITAGTATTAIVFLPNIVSSNNDIAIYLKHVGLSICIALGVSLVLAQTIVPLLASKLKPPAGKPKRTIIDGLIDRYHRTLDWSIRHHRASVGIILLLLVSVGVPGALVKMEFFDDAEDRRLRLRYNINDSYTVAKVEETVDIYEDYLFAHEDEFEIESIYSYYQGNYAMSTINLRTGKDAHRSIEEIKTAIRDSLPKVAIATPSFERMDQGRGNTVRVQLVGKSSEELAAISTDLAWTLSQLEGLSDVRSDAEAGEREVQVVVDRRRASQYGVSAREVATVVAAAMRGINLRRFRDREGEVEMRLMFRDTDRQSLDQLRNVPMILENGRTMPIGALADFRIERGPRTISRENRTTSLGVTAHVEGITTGEARDLVRNVMSRYPLPAGYTWNFGEQFDYEREAMNTMLVNMLLALALIYFVMAALFESLLFPGAIWTQIVFAVIGVYWFFLFTGTSMSLMGMIGILILIGVVVNNGIVLVDHINQLRHSGMRRNDAILQAGRDRLRPILMTAGTTVLSLVPLCVVRTQIGGDGPPYFPMARAIVGGLTFSTAITLLILPTIYIVLDDLRTWFDRIRAAAG